MIVVVFCLINVDVIIIAFSSINSVILIIIDVDIFDSAGNFALTCVISCILSRSVISVLVFSLFIEMNCVFIYAVFWNKY